MNKQLEKLVVVWRWIFENFIIYIPLVILTIVGGGYVYLLMTSPTSIERLRILVSLDAAIATMAGLSLYTSYTSRDDHQKKMYFACGERLFHAFILMFVATFMRGCVFVFHDFSWYTSWNAPIQGILVTVTIIFFLQGLFYLMLGLKGLLSFIGKVSRSG